MPDLALYRSNGSCAFVANAVLKELDIPFQTVLMKLIDRGHEAADGSMTFEEYCKIHPFGYVPVLKIDGEIVTELSAILSYIASLAPDRNLLGRTSLQRARVMEWMSFLSGSLHAYAFGMLLRPTRFTDDKGQEDAIRQKGRAKVEEYFTQVDTRIGNGDFVVGDEETVADFNVMIFYYWGLKHEIDMSRYPNYGRILRRMESKESVKAALREEGISPAF